MHVALLLPLLSTLAAVSAQGAAGSADSLESRSMHARAQLNAGLGQHQRMIKRSKQQPGGKVKSTEAPTKKLGAAYKDSKIKPSKGLHNDNNLHERYFPVTDEAANEALAASIAKAILKRDGDDAAQIDRLAPVLDPSEQASSAPTNAEEKTRYDRLGDPLWGLWKRDDKPGRVPATVLEKTITQAREGAQDEQDGSPTTVISQTWTKHKSDGSPDQRDGFPATVLDKTQVQNIREPPEELSRTFRVIEREADGIVIAPDGQVDCDFWGRKRDGSGNTDFCKTYKRKRSEEEDQEQDGSGGPDSEDGPVGYGPEYYLGVA